MHISTYIETRVAELRAMQEQYESNHDFDPESWPVEMEESAWFEQELAVLDVEHGRAI